MKPMPMARDANSLLRADFNTREFHGFHVYRPDVPLGSVRVLMRPDQDRGVTLTQDDVRALIHLLADAAAEAQLAAEGAA